MPNPFHYALVVGINLYPGFSNLNSPSKDVSEFKNWLLSEGGVPLENIKQVLTPAKAAFTSAWDAVPTRDEINRALRMLNASASSAIGQNPIIWKRSRLYLYFSGHGIAPEGGEAAVLMASAAADAMGENIPCAKYLRWYEQKGSFREVVVFADCCRLRRPAEFFGPPFDGKEPMDTVTTLLGFATQQGDAAYEPDIGGNPDEARSYFTQAILEGLRGAAADKITGQIDSVGLADYTNERVKALTANKTYPQIPKMPVDLNKRIVFGQKNPAAIEKRQVTVHFPAGFTNLILLQDDVFKEITRHDPTSGDLLIPLPDGLYIVKLAATGLPIPSPNFTFRILGADRDVIL